MRNNNKLQSPLLSSFAIIFVICFSLCTHSRAETPPACPNGPIKSHVALSPDNRKVVTLNSNVISTRSLGSSYLFDSQTLPLKGNLRLMGFINSHEVFIFNFKEPTADPDSPFKNMGYAFNISTYAGRVLWEDNCGKTACLSPNRNTNVMGQRHLGTDFSRYFIFGLDGMFLDANPYVMDMLTGQRKSLPQEAGTYLELLRSSCSYSKNSSLYCIEYTGMQDNFLVKNWDLSATSISLPTVAITLPLRELALKKDHYIRPRGNEPIHTGNERNIVVSMQEWASDALTREIFIWHNLEEGSRKICSLPLKPRQGLSSMRIFDENRKVAILLQSYPNADGSPIYYPKYLDFSDCSLKDIPSTHAFKAYEGAENVLEFAVYIHKDRTLFYNNTKVIDSKYGYYVAGLCSY